MIHVVERIRLNVPVAIAWERLSDLEWLMCANVFHQSVRFLGERRRGTGAKAIVDHGLPIGPRVPRLVRITHWDDGRRIRWTDVDPTYPTYLFPHSEEFSLAAGAGGTTILTDELRGTLNLRPRSVGNRVDQTFAQILAGWAVRRQCRYIRAIIGGTSGGPTG